MGIFVPQEDELKSELVRRICSVLTSTVSPFKPSYIDWYLLLGIEENAETDKIRKQYRKLALQLHPDKNQHPKADVAFKLVSEAYICLTDKAKRRAFDFERRKNKCEEEWDRARRSRSQNIRSKDVAEKNTKSSRDVFKERFIQENIVIQNCLKAQKPKPGEDYPVFDPANYMSQNYPHYRTQFSHRYSRDYLRKENVQMSCRTRGIKCESPVFNWFR